MFRNNVGLGNSEIGRWLGISHRVGQLMLYWILPTSGIPISCNTVQLVTEMERRTNEFQEKMKQYDTKVNARIGDHV